MLNNTQRNLVDLHLKDLKYHLDVQNGIDKAKKRASSEKEWFYIVQERKSQESLGGCSAYFIKCYRGAKWAR